jgi:hypothetical protein
MKMSEPSEQCTLCLCIPWVELPHLRIKNIIEEQRTILRALRRRYVGIKPAPLFCFVA